MISRVITAKPEEMRGFIEEAAGTAYYKDKKRQAQSKLESTEQNLIRLEDITKSYFETYHGKVSRLGYTKTAKCYDCHGAHDILRVSDARSHLSHDNVVQTCQKCHAGATRRFAGYLTHATHHDPAKYPFLFWTFWGMTTLLVTTFIFGGVHTLLWLPRALQMRREHRRKAAQRTSTEKHGSDAPDTKRPGAEG